MKKKKNNSWTHKPIHLQNLRPWCPRVNREKGASSPQVAKLQVSPKKIVLCTKVEIAWWICQIIISYQLIMKVRLKRTTRIVGKATNQGAQWIHRTSTAVPPNRHSSSRESKQSRRITATTSSTDPLTIKSSIHTRLKSTFMKIRSHKT